MLNRKLLFALCLGLVLLLAVHPALAASKADQRLENTIGSRPSYDVDSTDEDTLTEYIGNIISVFLGLLGVVFVLLIVYAGYNWMTAAGKAEKVEKAQHTIKVAIIGIIIIIGVYAMWQFVFVRIVQL